MGDIIEELERIYKNLELKQLYKAEDLIKKAIYDLEESMEISDMDKAKLKHLSIQNETNLVR